MWRKPADAKPSSQSLDSPAAVSTKVQSTSVTAPPAPSPEIVPDASASSAPVAAPPAHPVAPAVAPPPVVRGISRISSGLRINGQISGDDDLYIDGQAEGQFHFPQAKVTVGPNGKVKANIEAREIVVEGTVTGDLRASAGVQLGGSSRVQGSLITPRIAIDDGARLRGKVEMTRAGDAKQVQDLAPISTAAITKTNEAPRAIAHASGE
ncbi:MAG TPA: polymer-forming cytoskeletal protein [Candidatus Acidoferrales bacterium]|nr:polymer-forming cytoskeletal protein [Candidatus Acidoferrales bacterium]